MVKVSIPGSYVRGWAGPGGIRSSIGKTVSFERTAQAWRSWAPRFASRVAGVGGGYLGAAALVAGLGYDAYRYMARRRAKPAKRGTRVRRGGVRKYGVRRGRKNVGRSFVAGLPVSRKRTAAAAFVARAQGRLGLKRRRYGRSAIRGQAHEIQFSGKRTIRIGRGRMLPRRQLKLGYHKRILRWQQCLPLNAGGALPGALRLSHKDEAGGGTWSPCYLACLNSTVLQEAGNANPVYQLVFSDTGVPVFNTVYGQQSTGAVTGGEWQVEYFKDDVGYSNRYVLNSWYDIRLNCYGAKAQPTLYDIRIVSFPKDFYDPLIGATGADLEDRKALWQSLVHSYMSNPLMPAMKLKALGMITHFRTKFVIQPGQNIENDVTPANRLLRFFVKDNSVYDYTKHAEAFSGAGADNKLDTVQWVPQGGAGTVETSPYPLPRARKWLLVRAMNTTRTADDSVNYTPSFDIIIRKGEYLQAD